MEENESARPMTSWTFMVGRIPSNHNSGHNFNNITNWIFTQGYSDSFVWDNFPNFAPLSSSTFRNFLHMSSICGSITQIWIKSDFQFSVMHASFSLRLYKFKDFKVHLIRRTQPCHQHFFNIRTWLFLTAIPIRELSVTNSTRCFITVNPSISLYHILASPDWHRLLLSDWSSSGKRLTMMFY